MACTIIIVLLCVSFTQSVMAYTPTGLGEDDPDVDDSCDFVIVGAGTTTLALAGRLSEIPHWKICIFERGPIENNMTKWKTNRYMFTSPHDPFWLTQTAFATNVGTASRPYNKIKDGRNIHIARFRGRGGTSRVYGAIARRASPAVLNMWPDGWKHNSFTKYYKKLEDHYCHYDSNESTNITQEECERWHGQGGAMQLNSQIVEAFRKFPREMRYLCEDETKPWKGYAADYNGPEEHRISCSVFQQYKLRINGSSYPSDKARRDRTSKTARGSSFTGYYSYRKNKPELFTSSPVTKILFQDGKAIGVKYFDVSSSTIRTIRAKKEVIVGAGSFDTPHLLQLSGVGPRDLLERIGIDVIADNKHVGQHLWDHISVPYVLKLSKESNDFCGITEKNEEPTVKIDGKIYKTKDLDSINGPFSWIIHYRSSIEREPQNMSDIQLYVMGESKLFDQMGPLCTSNTYNACSQKAKEEDGTNEGTIRIIDQWPEYRGSINATTANIFDKPILEYGWNYTLNGIASPHFEKVSQLFREQIKLLRDMFFGEDVSDALRSLVLGEVAPGTDIDTDEKLNAWIRSMLVSALHPVGTCKMPECADEFLQVKGVSGLRVCDASAFATQIDGNPSATLYGMAEKLADILKFQYIKYINMAVRKELPIPVSENNPFPSDDNAAEMIKSITKCFDAKMSGEWLSTGKGTSATIVKWSLLCSEDTNEGDIADILAAATLGPVGKHGCGIQDYPLFDRVEATLPPREPTSKHDPSSFVFLVWCQFFKDVSPEDLWDKVGAWHGNNGMEPGSENCFALNCQPRLCSVLQHIDQESRELIYTEPNIHLPVTDYISTKKVVSRSSGVSSAFMRTASMISNPGEDWYQTASYLLENVYQSSGHRYSRGYPPLNKQSGWWTERSDGLLYYESTRIHSNDHVASFDLDGTIIKTKSGNTFPVDENDWIFTSTNVKSTIRKNYQNGINNVIMSNQNGIATGTQDKGEWMTKIENIVAQLDVPMFVLAATKYNKYRKPYIGMWDYYSCTLNMFNTIDKSKAVYVDDAAGRPDDFSDSGKEFAENIGIAFSTPERYFAKKEEL